MAKYVMTFCFFLAMSTVQVANSEAGEIIIDDPDIQVNQSCDECFHFADDVTGNIRVVGPNVTVSANNVYGNISAAREGTVIVRGDFQGDISIESGACVIVRGNFNGNTTIVDAGALRREGKTCD